MASAVFFAVLNMGLGHATRSLPLIREFHNRRWRIFIGSSGRSLEFLRQEISSANFVELPDYNLTYSRRGVNIAGLLLRVPSVLAAIAREHEITERLIAENNIELVISDHRYGCYSETVPSHFISHQLRFIAPRFFRPFEFIGERFNQHYHRKYSSVIVPDVLSTSEGWLSGRLSRKIGSGNYNYPGILSSISAKPDSLQDIDVLISISGPEPQRSLLEHLVRSQLPELSGKIIVTLGVPESDVVEKISEDVTIYQHLPRLEMEDVFNRSRLVVTRSGYSTLMELAELEKRALLIPTPGQTEQVYLANRLREKGQFYSVEQRYLNLKNDIVQALRFPGISRNLSTAQTVKDVIEILTGEQSKCD